MLALLADDPATSGISSTLGLEWFVKKEHAMGEQACTTGISENLTPVATLDRRLQV
jgi:hypothetical protein